MQIQPYLNFDGRCEEAIKFYEKTLGAKDVKLMRFSDAPPQPGMNPAAKDKIMHASFTVGDTELLASDGQCQGKAQFQGVSLSYTVPGEAATEKIFGALSDGGQVRMPLATTFFAKRFGQLTERFGVAWMIVSM